MKQKNFEIIDFRKFYDFFERDFVEKFINQTWILYHKVPKWST